MHFVLVLQGAADIDPIPVQRQIDLIGRDPNCDVVLNRGNVSRRHLAIAEVDGRVYVRDLGSTNGVLVNGQRVTGGRWLELGDRLRIGEQWFQLRRADEEGLQTVIPDG